MYNVTQLLLEDLAEHILLELTSCLATLTENWLVDTVTRVKISVIVLMEAAGEVVNDVDKRRMILDNLLGRFLTGTEKKNAWKTAAHP